MRRNCWQICLVVMSVLAMSATATADIKMPAIFGDHMVLQQGQKDRVWGSAEPGEEITVSIDKQTKTAKTGGDGKWKVTLDPMSVGGPHTLMVKGKNTVKFDDVLVGEVWICSGQSNMQWSVNAANDPDLEKRSAKFPKIRLISVPQLGTQEPQDNFNGNWQLCTPETVGGFSAVGYFFGRQLHQTLDMPIGMINDAWGGSACEAWIRRDLLAAEEKYKPLLDRWAQTEDNFAKLSTKTDLTDDQKKQLADLANRMRGNARPGNIYNGVLKPTIGYGIRGAIWYQGESNAGRAYQYRDLFPLMIKSWRDEWAIGDFSFYWVQLADFKAEKPEAGESDWAELREAQTMTMTKLPNTGEAVIIDIGEGQDIHPKNKQDVAKRLARWALARDYGIQITHRSPQFKSMEKQGYKMVLTFDYVAAGLRAFDVKEPRGFAIAGEDKKFVWAQASLVQGSPNKVEVWSDSISDPVAVRYAWADNPVCNLYSRDGLPVTPFRTDEWEGVTAKAR